MATSVFEKEMLPSRLNRPGDLRSFVLAARSAAAADNWFAALALALTLPEICAAVDDPGPGRSRERYIAWWDIYMAHHYVVRPDADENWEAFTYLPGPDAYGLRCAFLHAGTDVIEGKNTKMTRIRFMGPPSSLAFGYNEPLETLNVGLEQFVEWVCQAVEIWLNDRQGDEAIQARLQGLVSIIPSAIRLPSRPRQP